MTKVVFVSLLVMSSYFGFSQTEKETSVEKSVFGVQVGLIGIWAHNELKLSNQVALRSEIGIGGVNTGRIEPMLILAPRWYYNLDKRANNNMRIDNNSGNYISFRARYQFQSIVNAEKNIQYDLLLVSTWGIRRNIGNHFNYEAGLGGGLGFDYNDERKIVLIPYVNLRVGYHF